MIDTPVLKKLHMLPTLDHLLKANNIVLINFKGDEDLALLDDIDHV